jgi:hypothetical protein
MATADAPTSKRLHLRGVDKDTLPKVVRAIATSRPWRAACVEYARRTDYGERGHAGLSSSDLAPVLRLILQAVEQNVTFGGSASIQDLAKLGCPGALLSVVEMQVKKASRPPESHQAAPRTTTSPPQTTTGASAPAAEQKPRPSPAARLGRRPTTSPGRISRRPTGSIPGGQDIIAAMTANPTTMSVFSVRRVRLVNRNDERAKFRIDGISGGEDTSLFLNVSPDQQLLSQVRELELLEKRTFVPAGKLAELIERELSGSNDP